MNTTAEAFSNLCEALGAGIDAPALYAQLLNCYNEPQRKYHTQQHLNECLLHFYAVKHLAEHAAEVEMALWFHDAIYALDRHDNERQSADWAVAVLTTAAVDENKIARIHALIMATEHNAAPTNADAQLLVDIDLAILGAQAPRFAEYERQIRDEYAFVPEALFKQKRREILQGFLTRPRLYSTPYFYEALEQRARQNLTQACAQTA